MRKPRDRSPAHPLVGKWFHAYHPDRPDVLTWQGHLLAEVSPGQFLVQLFEWVIGDPTKQVIVPLADMALWHFYDSNKAMNWAYEKYAERQNQVFNAVHGDGVTPPPKTDGPVH